MPRYDAIVLGSGQAGNPLAQKLADHGWSVALVEKEHLGGTCVNTGCTPTKTMIASAQVPHYARHAARWGVRRERSASIYHGSPPSGSRDLAREDVGVDGQELRAVDEVLARPCWPYRRTINGCKAAEGPGFMASPSA